MFLPLCAIYLSNGIEWINMIYWLALTVMGCTRLLETSRLLQMPDYGRLQTNSIALLQYYAEGKVAIGTMGTMDHYGVCIVLLQAAADGPGFADAPPLTLSDFRKIMLWCMTQTSDDGSHVVFLSWLHSKDVDIALYREQLYLYCNGSYFFFLSHL
jgi:hypothetical protein